MDTTVQGYCTTDMLQAGLICAYFRRYFIKALTLFPKHASIHLKYAGFLRHVRKDIPRATAHYQEATEANPQYADALGSYASFLHGTGGGDKGQTESLYQRAIEVSE